jgi:HSP20 family protein
MKNQGGNSMNLVRFQKPAYMYDVNNLFNDFLKDFSTEKTASTCKTMNPSVNVMDKEKKYTLEFFVPGFEKENFEVKNADGILTVKGKVNEINSETTKVTRREFYIADFERRFTLPEDVETDSINAKYYNGILIVEMPKREVETKKGVFDIQVN